MTLFKSAPRKISSLFRALSTTQSRMAITDCYSSQRLSDTVWRIQDNDAYGESPFVYLVAGKDRNVLIDTGCGTGDLKTYVQTILHSQRGVAVGEGNLLVVNTHNHFDHVGANHQFPHIAVGNAVPAYTLDRFNTMGWAKGCRVEPYSITHWLSNHEQVVLSAASPTDESLEVIFCPGHTPDSLALYYPKDRRLFVGDFLYTDAPIFAVTPKCCPKAYQTSAELLCSFVEAKEKQGDEGSNQISLSCGHVNQSLESRYLSKLSDMLRRVNGGELSGTGSSGLFVEYVDGDLRFMVRRVMFMDRVLTPVLKLFY